MSRVEGRREICSLEGSGMAFCCLVGEGEREGSRSEKEDEEEVEREGVDGLDSGGLLLLLLLLAMGRERMVDDIVDGGGKSGLWVWVGEGNSYDGVMC